MPPRYSMLQEFHHVFTNILELLGKLGWKWFVCPLNITPNSPHYLVQLHCSRNDAKMAQLDGEGGKGRELTRLASGSHRQQDRVSS